MNITKQCLCQISKRTYNAFEVECAFKSAHSFKIETKIQQKHSSEISAETARPCWSKILIQLQKYVISVAIIYI